MNGIVLIALELCDLKGTRVWNGHPCGLVVALFSYTV